MVSGATGPIAQRKQRENEPRAVARDAPRQPAQQARVEIRRTKSGSMLRELKQPPLRASLWPSPQGHGFAGKSHHGTSRASILTLGACGLLPNAMGARTIKYLFASVAFSPGPWTLFYCWPLAPCQTGNSSCSMRSILQMRPAIKSPKSSKVCGFW